MRPSLRRFLTRLTPLLFNVLNTIGRLAFLEDASRTETMVHDFSDMMRYLLRKNNNGLITLGREMNYVNCYMAIQKSE